MCDKGDFTIMNKLLAQTPAPTHQNPSPSCVCIACWEAKVESAAAFRKVDGAFDGYVFAEGTEIPKSKTTTSPDLINHPPHYTKGGIDTFDLGHKFDSDKIRFELITPEFEKLLAQVLTLGAKKYGDRNWEKGIKYSRIIGAIQRHLNSFLMNKDTDEESGLSHLSHAACGIMFLLTYEARNMKQFDDIPTRKVEETENGKPTS